MAARGTIAVSLCPRGRRSGRAPRSRAIEPVHRWRQADRRAPAGCTRSALELSDFIAARDEQLQMGAPVAEQLDEAIELHAHIHDVLAIRYDRPGMAIKPGLDALLALGERSVVRRLRDQESLPRLFALLVPVAARAGQDEVAESVPATRNGVVDVPFSADPAEFLLA